MIDVCQLLELLWELAHLPMLKTSLVELALEEHLAVLTDPFAIKEQVKKQYVIKCVEDIREVLSVLLIVGSKCCRSCAVRLLNIPPGIYC